MNECFQSCKTILPYGALLTTVFEAFDILITDDDEVMNLRPTDTYNHASLRCMGYIFTDKLWRHMFEIDEKEYGSEGGS